MKQPNSQSGLVLTIALVLGLAFATIALAVAQFALTQYTSSRRAAVAGDAVALADAGGDNFMYHINQNGQYDGTDGSGTGAQTCSNTKVESTLFSNSTQGKGTFETCAQNGSISGEKIVYSTGRVYLPASSSKPLITRKIKLVIEQSTAPAFGLQTGPAGLILGNNTTITTGNVYTNGFIQMSNNSQIGTAANPVNVWAANYSCPSTNPPGSSYPVLCSNGTDPITIQNGGHIYGNVQANGENSSGTNAAAMSNPGLTATSGVGLQPLPSFDRTGTKATITTTMTNTNASSCSGAYTTWTNVHITGGDVSLPNNCTITVGGNVWIDGALNATGNNDTMQVSSSLTSAPKIMVDGSDGFIMGNGNTLASNSGGVGFYIATFWNAENNPDATSLSGNDLYNSEYIGNDRTDPHYTIKTGNNANAASGSTLYALWSGVQVNNNGSAGQVLGQIIDLNSNGSVTFNTGTTGGTTVWNVRYYEQQ